MPPTSPMRSVVPDASASSASLASATSSGFVSNRIRALLVHIPHYCFEGQARLARDAGVSRSTISRLINGRINPSFRLVRAVTDALSRRLDEGADYPVPLPLDPREVFTTEGAPYPTPSACTLCGCRGCLPEEAYDRSGNRRPDWKDARPGDWSRS